MMDKRSKLIIYFLIALILGIGALGYIYSKNSLTEAFDAYNTDVSLFEEHLNKLKERSNSDLQIATSTDLSVSGQGDLFHLNYGPAAAFYYGTSPNYSNGTDIRSAGGAINGSDGYISVPNGTYYFFTLNVNNMQKIAKGPVKVTGSCNDDPVPTNQTGSVTIQRCFIKTSTSISPAHSVTMQVCANGYSLETTRDISSCTNAKLVNGIKRRYCKVVYNLKCVKKGGSDPQPPVTVPAARLAGLSVSSGSLSPAFKAGTFKYTVNVDSNVSSINIDASLASGASFVNGYGPRTVNLNYGSNTAQIRVKNSAGAVTKYTLTINRTDGRSSVNTLSNIRTNYGTLTPAFSSENTNYTVDVGNEVSNITIDATLTDGTSSFVSGYGPSTYPLELGPNKIYIKVANQKGEVNVYNITVNRETTPSECTTNTEELALLKQIELSVDMPNVEIDQIEDFDSKIFTYNNIKVPYMVTSFQVKPYFVDDGDTYEIEGTDDLEVGEVREVKITVKSSKCPNYTNVYTLNVQRQPEVTLGDSAELRSLTINDHDEFEFDPTKLNYDLVLHKGEDKLGINYTTVQEKATCEILSNENLSYGSVVTVRCISEDEEEVLEYNITIDGVEKGTNVFLIVILVIIIILVLIYLVLRLLGYKIYFNFEVFGSFFRGIGEKFNNMFDK